MARARRRVLPAMIPLSLALLLAAAAPPLDAVAPVDASSLRTGDLVFQASRSGQSEAIRQASGSELTHVGVVVVEGGRPFVVEAVATTSKTTWSRFSSRGDGGRVLVLRMPGLDDAQRSAIAKAALARLGAPYDPYFAEGEEALYCTELVELAYRAAGVELRGWRKVGELALGAPAVQALVGARWRGHPLCRGDARLSTCLAKVERARILTPGDLAADERLVVVPSSFAADPGRADGAPARSQSSPRPTNEDGADAARAVDEGGSARPAPR